MRKNEHPRCGCRTCRHAASMPWGKFVHRAVNRRIRHGTKRLLHQLGEDFDLSVVVSTPRF